jgi:Cu(I)/Ag(I) efflux system membrane fusion protein
MWTGPRSIVYVSVPDRKNPTFIYREIELGAEAGDEYVVNSGLQEGEEIAVNGVFKIDAAAQLAGKTSMMSPPAGSQHSMHDHQGSSGEMEEIMMTSFKVAGNCSMCKNRIEKAAKSLKGVRQAEWDVESKVLKVSFVKGQVNVDQIHKVIAAAGHDTEKETAPDDVYRSLPACCAYRK